MSEWLARLLWLDPEPEPEGPTPEPEEEEAGEVEAAAAAYPLEIELAAHPGPPPVDLLEEDPLEAVEGWSPEDRIRRSFSFGQQDALSALFQRFLVRGDRFPLQSTVYVILYHPNGNWPRYTDSLVSFYQEVKIVTPGQLATWSTPSIPGVVSRGFPSVVEAKAYVVGASCRWPNQAF